MCAPEKKATTPFALDIVPLRTRPSIKTLRVSLSKQTLHSNVQQFFGGLPCIEAIVS